LQAALVFQSPGWEDFRSTLRLVFKRTSVDPKRRQDMTDQEQKVERVEKLDEPDVEAHRLDKMDRAEPGRADIGASDEKDEPDVEAHRFDKFEGRHDKLD
jgi:hypothetical protein